MTLRSPREIAARLVFTLYVALPPLGGLALILGLTRSSPTAGWLGGATLILFAVLHLRGRRAFGFGNIVHELRHNPFKPLRPPPPTPDPAQPKARCECGSGSLL